MTNELKNRIRKFNQITNELKKEGLFTIWNEEEKKTEIYIPGDYKRFPKVVGYITKNNEVIRFQSRCGGIK